MLYTLNDETTNEWHDARAELNPAHAVDWSGIPDSLRDKYEIYCSCVADPVSFDEWLAQ